jgi:hypothetical protein
MGWWLRLVPTRWRMARARLSHSPRESLGAVAHEPPPARGTQRDRGSTLGVAAEDCDPDDIEQSPYGRGLTLWKRR